MDASGQSVKEEFDGGVELARAAPHSDDEVHRHQHHLPEHVKEQEIHRDEYADHACLLDQEHGVVFLSRDP